MDKQLKIAALLATVILATAGCAGNNANTNDSVDGGGRGSESDPDQARKKTELTIMSLGDTWIPNNAFLPVIENATGTKLSMQVIPEDQYVSKRNVVMVSGSLPNVIRIKYQDPMYMSYAEEGLLLPLDAYLDKHPAVKDAFTKEQWDMNRNPADGNIYHIPRITGFYPNLFMYRKDVLDKNGLKAPSTVDELRTVLEALKARNQDKDYVPFVGNRNNISDLDPFFNAFGTGFMVWEPSAQDASRIELSSATDKFKQALIYIRDLRKDGLFEPQWMVGKERGIDKFYTGKGDFTMDVPQYAEYRIPTVQESFPAAVISWIPYLKGPNGDGGPFVRKNEQDYGVALTKGTNEEQVEGFFRLLEYFYTGEGFNLSKYGFENVNYDLVDGKKVKRDREDESKKPDPGYDMENMDRLDFANSPQFFQYVREEVPSSVSDEEFDLAVQVLGEADKHAREDMLSNNQDPVIAERYNKLQSLTEEVISKIVLDSKSDADGVFGDYLNKMKQNGLDEVTEAVNRLN